MAFHQFKRYIRNIFPIAGLRIFRRNRGDFLQKDEYLVVSRYGNQTAVGRQTINDEQFLITFEDFLQEVADNTAQLDGVVTGASLVGGTTLTLTRSQGLSDVTVNLSSLDNLDGVVTGASIDGSNILTLTRSESLSNVTVDLSQFIQTAAQVSTTSIPEVTGTNVQTMLSSLKGLIDNILFTSLNTDGGAVSLTTVNTTPLDSLFIRLTVNSDITSISFTDVSRMRLFVMQFISTGAARSIEFGPGFIFDESNNAATNFALEASPDRKTVLGWYDGTNWNCTLISNSGEDDQTASEVNANAIAGITGTEVQTLLESLKTLADNIVFAQSLLTSGGALNLVTTNGGNPTDFFMREINVTSNVTSISFSDVTRLQAFLLRFSSTSGDRTVTFGAGFDFDESNPGSTTFDVVDSSSVTVLGFWNGVAWQSTIISDRQTASEVAVSAISGLSGTTAQEFFSSLKILDDGQIQVNSSGSGTGALAITTTSATEFIIQEVDVIGAITDLSFTNTTRLNMFLLRFSADGTLRNVDFGAGFEFDESNSNTTPFDVPANERVSVLGFLSGGTWFCTIISKPEGAGGGGAFWPLSGTGSVTANNTIEATGATTIEIRNQDAGNDRARLILQEFGPNKNVNTVAQSPTSTASVDILPTSIRSTVGNAAPDTGGQFFIQSGTLSAQYNDYSSSPEGIRYGGDYSATLTDRSLIDKGFLDSRIQTARVELSSAQILALNTTPITIVSAQGANTFITLVSPVTLVYNFGTIAYATNVNVNLRYAVGTVLTNFVNILNQPDSRIVQINSGLTGGPIVQTDTVNQGIVVTETAGDPTAGDGTVIIEFSYRVITTV